MKRSQQESWESVNVVFFCASGGPWYHSHSFVDGAFGSVLTKGIDG